MVADIGTGDGRAVLARATAEPASLVFGVDASAAAMTEASRRAARRGPSNAIFLAAGAEALAGTVLAGCIDLVTVTFPWGSLLRGLVGLDAAALSGVATLVAPGGRLEALLSVVPSDGVEGIGALDASCEPMIRSAWARAGLDLESMRLATTAEIAASRSSWARRLGSGPDARSVWRLETVPILAARHTPRMGHIVLVGLMGSGKTTVGAALAASLAVPHRDSDTDIQRQTGLTGREITARDGIDALHTREARHLLDALRQPDRTVISAAASTLDDPTCRSSLSAGDDFVVWLRASPAVLAARLRHDDHRPDLGEDLEDVIAQQAARRDRALCEAADLTLDATQPTTALVDAIVTHSEAVG